jgi:hypothetical protein
MAISSQWLHVAAFGAGYEADFAETVLRAHDIPVLRRGPEIGIFGPGFAGATARGVELLVPAERLEEAQAALASEPG